MEKIISVLESVQEMQKKAIEKGFEHFSVEYYKSSNRVCVSFRPTADDDYENFTVYFDNEKDFTKSRKYQFLEFCLNYNEENKESNED